MRRFEDLLRAIVTALNNSGIKYMLTGAIAVSYYGTPRTTMDADIILQISKKRIQKQLIDPLQQINLKIDIEKILNALTSDYRIISLQDKESPFTLDIIFTDENIQRREGRILGLPTFYQLPEDLILAKLRMIKATMSEERAYTDRADIKAILQYTKVDQDVLRRKANQQNDLHLLEKILSEF